MCLTRLAREDEKLEPCTVGYQVVHTDGPDRFAPMYREEMPSEPIGVWNEAVRERAMTEVGEYYTTGYHVMHTILDVKRYLDRALYRDEAIVEVEVSGDKVTGYQNVVYHSIPTTVAACRKITKVVETGTVERDSFVNLSILSMSNWPLSPSDCGGDTVYTFTNTQFVPLSPVKYKSTLMFNYQLVADETPDEAMKLLDEYKAKLVPADSIVPAQWLTGLVT